MDRTYCCGTYDPLGSLPPKEPPKESVLKELARPLQKWLLENYNPHCKIEITTTAVEVLSGELCVQFTKQNDAK